MATLCRHRLHRPARTQGGKRAAGGLVLVPSLSSSPAPLISLPPPRPRERASIIASTKTPQSLALSCCGTPEAPGMTAVHPAGPAKSAKAAPSAAASSESFAARGLSDPPRGGHRPCAAASAETHEASASTTSRRRLPIESKNPIHG